MENDGMEAFRNWLEIAYWVSHILLLIVALCAAFFAYRQFRSFGTIELDKKLNEPEMKEARGHVDQLAAKPLKEWSDYDREQARILCNHYDVAGRLLIMGFASKKYVLRAYSKGVQRTFLATKDFVQDQKEIYGHRAEYWEGYKWLYEKARRKYPLISSPVIAGARFAKKKRRPRWPLFGVALGVFIAILLAPRACQ